MGQPGRGFPLHWKVFSSAYGRLEGMRSPWPCGANRKANRDEADGMGDACLRRLQARLVCLARFVSLVVYLLFARCECHILCISKYHSNYNTLLYCISKSE